MVRIADILKNEKHLPKKEEPKEKPSHPVVPLSPKPSVMPPRPAPPEQKRSVGGFSFTRLGGAGQRAAKPAQEALSQEEGPRRYVAEAIQSNEANLAEGANTVYQQGLALAQAILAKAKTGEEIRGQELHTAIEDIIRTLTYGNAELINLACCQPLESETNFLAAKMVNKAILAIEIGIGKKLNKSQLFQLGMAALFSDLGVTQVLDVVTKKEVLTPEDWVKIQSIPAKTVEILKRIPDLHQVVITVAQEFRQKPEETGLLVKELEHLDPFSRIVTLIDVFEALTHDRPYRSRLMPHEAMRLILHEGGKKFEQEALRILIDRIGLYPIGSWVKLSSKEFAKVLEANPNHPLRPVVKVMFDERGKSLEEPYRIDLSRNISIQVTQPVSEEDLQKLAKKSQE